ncbi:hypothetical protein [Snodgrassella sp. CFCC 13594]|uniref:hypothetical protein n=1 Tax=Snodgrassella sp. CFCC 13594 TaxID=1775559 RepID=UPI00082C8968|nr:hypothetical protein [Snodgrassella sp. CFCC 13594]
MGSEIRERNKQRENYKKSKIASQQSFGGGTYVPMPHKLLTSKEYAGLSPIAKALLVDMMAQYLPLKNNGDLCVAFSVMQTYGWKSTTTLRKARNELMDKGFIILTKQGDRKRPHLYAFTFFNIDPCTDIHGRSKIDLAPTEEPLNYWMASDVEHKPKLKLVM